LSLPGRGLRRPSSPRRRSGLPRCWRISERCRRLPLGARGGRGGGREAAREQRGGHGSSRNLADQQGTGAEGRGGFASGVSGVPRSFVPQYPL